MSDTEWHRLMATLREASINGKRQFSQPVARKELVKWPHMSVGRLEKGCLLVAHPMLVDSVLRRAVVLVADHDEEFGGHGLMLNLPSTSTVLQARSRVHHPLCPAVGIL